MGRAGVLDPSQVVVGVSAEEIVALALANVGTSWTGSPAGFVWGISNLAGLPFFDLEDFTDGPANTFIDSPEYESPHRWDENRWGDGWKTVASWDGHPHWDQPTAGELMRELRPGDIVRVYDKGNWHENSEPDADGPNAHSFIVVSVTGGKVEVVDVWGGTSVVKHDFAEIVAEMAEHGKFQSAYVSRIIDDFVDDHVPDTLEGNGYGDWSGFGRDLKVTSAPAASVAWTNGALELSFSYRVDNTGLFAAAPSQTGIYLSTDAIITSADTLLTLDAVAAIAAAGFSLENGKIVLPGNLVPGTYYIGVIADKPNAIGELNEQNNISPATAITIGTVDLAVAAAPPALQIVWAAAGGSFNLTYTIENHGAGLAAPASRAGIYLSTDAIITGADRLVAVDDVAGIVAGGSSPEGGTFVLPGDIGAGNYFIGVIADHANAVGETDESNNVSAGVRITIVTNGSDHIQATVGLKSWHGLAGNDTLNGTVERDALYGDNGRDALNGRAGNDTLIGGNGADTLKGGSGADYFQFNTVEEIGTKSGKRDVIRDWDPAADYIDLRNIDAKEPSAADNAFTFIAAEGSSFSGAKGELRWDAQNNAGTSNDRTLVLGDVDGDGRADFILEIKGLHTMRAVDFLL